MTGTRGGEWRLVTPTLAPPPIWYWIIFNQHINNLSYKRIPASRNMMPMRKQTVHIVSMTIYVYSYVSGHIGVTPIKNGTVVLPQNVSGLDFHMTLSFTLAPTSTIGNRLIPKAFILLSVSTLCCSFFPHTKLLTFAQQNWLLFLHVFVKSKTNVHFEMWCPVVH